MYHTDYDAMGTGSVATETQAPAATDDQRPSADSSTLASIAVIGASITIRGDVTAAESLVVQGIVEGSLDIRDHDLIIGQTGQVVANVAAREIRVEGEVTGDLFGTEKVTVAKNGLVAGNIISPRVTLEDGAVFKGSIDMSPAPQASLAFDQSETITTNNLDSAFANTVADATQTAFEDKAGVAEHYANQAMPSPLFDATTQPVNPSGPSTAEEAKQALQEVRRQFAPS